MRRCICLSSINRIIAYFIYKRCQYQNLQDLQDNNLGNSVTVIMQVIYLLYNYNDKKLISSGWDEKAMS